MGCAIQNIECEDGKCAMINHWGNWEANRCISQDASITRSVLGKSESDGFDQNNRVKDLGDGLWNKQVNPILGQRKKTSNQTFGQMEVQLDKVNHMVRELQMMNLMKDS